MIVWPSQPRTAGKEGGEGSQASRGSPPPCSQRVSTSLKHLKLWNPETKPQPFPQTKSPFRFLGFCQLQQLGGAALWEQRKLFGVPSLRRGVSTCLMLINTGHLQGFSAHLVSYCLSDRSIDFLVITLALPTVSSSLVQTRTCSRFPNVSPLTACLRSLSPSSEGDCEVMDTWADNQQPEFVMGNWCFQKTERTRAKSQSLELWLGNHKLL